MTREASQADLDSVVSIVMDYRKFYGVESQNESEVRAFIKARMENNQSKIFIAQDENKKTVGFIQLYPSYSTVSLRPQWILNDFFVALDHRKKGYGQALMQSVKKYFSETAKGFILVTDKTNSTAKKFYEKNGWQTGEYDFYTFYY